MKIYKIAIAAAVLFLSFAIGTSIVMQTANAHTPPWTITTYAYLTVVPNPIGVGQTASVVMWLNIIPPTAGGAGGDRWRNLKLEITKPDGTKETLGPFTSDPVGSAYTEYTPTQVGTYTFTFSFPGQVLSLTGPTGIAGTASDYVNDTYTASQATVTLSVQQEEISAPVTHPLPTEYWTRPIEGQNQEWYKIASNWLGGAHIVGRVQPDGTAPNSPHIMWTQPISFGGVVGGSRTGLDAITYYSGPQYETKFTNPMIINGRLYYALPLSNAATGSGYVCVDLHTGKQIWWQNYTTVPTYGQLYDYESMNQHGVIPNGYLWTSNFANAYDPFTGNWLFSMTNVPSGTEVYGPNGEITRYVLNYAGRWLALWNTSAAPNSPLVLTPGTTTNAYQYRPLGKTANMGTSYTWNVSIPTLSGLASPTIIKVIPDNLVFGRSTTLQSAGGTASGAWGTPEPYTLWAISLKPSSRGQLMWIKNYTAPPNNITMLVGPVDEQTGVFTMQYRETMQWFGFDLQTGNQLWGPTPVQDAWNFYSGTSGALTTNTVAYGKLYSTGYSGILYCYDLTNGKLLWNYTAPSGFNTPYGGYPLGIGAVADGKIYLFTSEHSPNVPPYVGAKVRCVNAETGEEIWTVGGWAHTNTMALADGYLVYNNLYDMQIYCIGKGPSATTIDAPRTAVPLGSSIVITGTVMDNSAGTKQYAQMSRFPNGVAAVSDESMSEWMEYVYMQKPCPTNVKGVEVTLDVIDSNNNYRPIGKVMTDESGAFSFMWMPDIAGKYTVIATFAGSESYWPSYAETAFGVDEAPPATAPPEYPQPIDPTWTIIGVGIAIMFLVAIFGVLMLRKK